LSDNIIVTIQPQIFIDCFEEMFFEVCRSRLYSVDLYECVIYMGGC